MPVESECYGNWAIYAAFDEFKIMREDWSPRGHQITATPARILSLCELRGNLLHLKCIGRGMVKKKVLLDVELVRSLSWGAECGRRLREQRKSSGVGSQRALVEKLKGMEVTAYTSTIQNLESGSSSWVYLNTLLDICRGIGCEISVSINSRGLERVRRRALKALLHLRFRGLMRESFGS